jgi:hypothetical protein
VKTSEPRKVVRAADLPPPHRMSDEHFDVICVTFDVERNERQALRQQCDNVVDVFAGRLLDERRRPDRQGDRDWLRDALKATQKARAALPSRPGKAAEYPLRVGGPLLATVVTAAWLHEKFPAFQRLFVERTGWEPGKPCPDDPSAMVPAEFIGRETVPVLSALLAEIELVLQMAVNLLPLMPGGKGGASAGLRPAAPTPVSPPSVKLSSMRSGGRRKVSRPPFRTPCTFCVTTPK